MATQISRSGRTVSGNVAAEAVLRVDPGYSPDPDLVAIGTLVAILPLSQNGAPMAHAAPATAGQTAIREGEATPGIVSRLRRRLGHPPR